MTQQPNDRVVTLDLSSVVPDPENLRQHFDEQDLRALGDNIIEHGQMDPIQVFHLASRRYQIFDGERRWRASALVGRQTIKALIIEKPVDQELTLKRVSRAMQSRSLTPQEEVQALETALKSLGVAERPEEWGKAAKQLGLPIQLLRDRMRITRLAEPVRRHFEEGDLDLAAAQALGRLQDPKRQEEVRVYIEKNQLNTRFVGTKFIEKLVKHPDKSIPEVFTIALSEQRDPSRGVRRASPDETLADRLEDILADMRRTCSWLETAGREDLLGQLAERLDTMGRQRMVNEVQRLFGMCRAFMKYADGRTTGIVPTMLRSSSEEFEMSDSER
jgi:ParB family chromosome partitioning protein